MTEINQLSSVSAVAAGDLIVIYDLSNSSSRKTTLTNLLSWVESNINLTSAQTNSFLTQYSSPSATAFSVQVNNNSTNTHLILTPTGTFAAGTIVLPESTNLVDKQEILINCTQIVTALTINKNGATALTGAPTTLSANDYFKLKYDLVTSTWYRVG